MIVLDSNVVSELMKGTPATQVVNWAAQESRPGFFTTTVTMAEVLSGIQLLPKGRRRAQLETEARSLFEQDFEDRVLSFDIDAAKVYPSIVAGRRKAGRPIAPFDAQIASIALSRGAMLATRNTADFELCGVDLVNPWAD